MVMPRSRQTGATLLCAVCAAIAGTAGAVWATSTSPEPEPRAYQASFDPLGRERLTLAATHGCPKAMNAAQLDHAIADATGWTAGKKVRDGRWTFGVGALTETQWKTYASDENYNDPVGSLFVAARMVCDFANRLQGYYVEGVVTVAPSPDLDIDPTLNRDSTILAWAAWLEGDGTVLQHGRVDVADGRYGGRLRRLVEQT